MKIVEQAKSEHELRELIKFAETQEDFDRVYDLMRKFLTQTDNFEAFDELWKQYNYKAITRLTSQLQ
jgi:uncharacterized protein YozE (UPF0346 family)